jgi:hypothetical protein
MKSHAISTGDEHNKNHDELGIYEFVKSQTSSAKREDNKPYGNMLCRCEFTSLEKMLQTNIDSRKNGSAPRNCVKKTSTGDI